MVLRPFPPRPVRAKTRWARWLAGGALAVGALMVAAMWALWAAWDRAPVGTGPRPAAVPAAAAAPPGPLGTPGSTASVRATAEADPDPAPPGSIAVCGGNPISWVANTVDLLEQMFAGETRSMRRFSADLVGDSDPRRRAAGLVLGEAQAAQTLAGAARAAEAECAQDLECTRQRFKAASAQAAAESVRYRDALARLALQQQDSAIYGLAAQLCDGHAAAGGACQQISARSWAQRDPDNMAAWMLLASEASRQKDPAGLAEAVHRMSLARHQRHHDNLLIEAVQSNPQPLSAVAQLSRYAQAVSIVPARLMPQLQVLSAHCSPESVLDANHRLGCESLAEALTERSSDVLTMMVGTHIGERSGWSKERVAMLRSRAIVYARVRQLPMQPQELLSCRSMRIVRAHFAELAALGEVGAAQAQLTRTGQDLAELVRRTKSELEAGHAAAAASAAASGQAGLAPPVD